MQTRSLRHRWRAVLLTLLLGACIASAHAARVGILTNQYGPETAQDFATKVPGHTFTAIDVSTQVPTLASLTADFDVILLFEDATFVNAPAVGNVVAAYAQTGRAVVLGTFYDEDRSDGPPAFTPHGWGQLEQIDPNTTDGTGTPYAPRTLDPASLVASPLTTGVTRFTSNKYAGGNQAKAGTTVVAAFTQKNAKGGVDPAIAYRVTTTACVVHVAIAPNYPTIGVFGTDFDGDFYRIWRNAFDFGANHCSTAATYPPGDPANIPASSPLGLVATALLLALAGSVYLSRRG
ncbi:MAG TPA: hypothetical protein VMV45_02070 [Casimicrobiaceae bacterium]|nr:hypothetical protein [Casimicrobiaceae bacterium]